MKTLMCFVLLLAATFVHAAPERLISLQGTYAEELSKIEDEYLAAMVTLQTQYTRALGELEAAFREKGDLASLIKTTSEKDHFSVEKEHVISDVPEIGALQRRFAAGVALAALKAKEKKISLAKFYERSLTNLEKDLTRKNEIADAMKVMKERNKVTKARKAMVEAVASQSNAANKGKQSARKPMPATGQTPGNKLPPKLAADLALYHAFNSVKDKTVADQSGKSRHGVLHGVKFVADGRGKGNGALQFDGEDAHVALGNVLKDVDLPMTFACWVNITKFNGSWGSNLLIMSHVTPAQESGIHAGFNVSYTPHHTFWINLGDGKGITRGNRKSFMSANKMETLKEWVHLTISVSKEQDATFYLNGKRDPGPVKTSGDGMSVGHTDEPAAIGINFDGMLDDVMVWKRCLNDAEVKQLYTLTGGN